MPDFVKKLGTDRTPFGRNEFLRSTDGMKVMSATIAMNSMPYSVIDGHIHERVLQPGTVIARITSGPDAGKFGPFQAAGGTAEVQTLTKGTGTYSAGTYQLSAQGSTNPADIIQVPYADTASQVAALVGAMPAYNLFFPTATGGPLGSAAIVITFGGGDDLGDVPQLLLDVTNVTGQTGAGTATTGTAGVAGANDGRQTAANIIGLALTFLPWQLMERDVEIGVAYEASVVQGWCIEYNAAGTPVPLSNATAAFMQRGGAAGKTCDIGFF